MRKLLLPEFAVAAARSAGIDASTIPTAALVALAAQAQRKTIYTTHQPKGSMCMACVHAKRDCSALPFATMRVVERAGKVKIVRCSDFQASTPA